MNMQNYTQKSLEAIRTAQSMARENRNNYIMPEHLLYALVDQDGGLIPSLLGRMGVDCDAVLSELDTAIASLPKVGEGSDAYLSQETDRAFGAAETAAKSMGDEYVSVEHLMIGISRHQRRPGKHLRRAEEIRHRSGGARQEQRDRSRNRP